MITNNTNKDFLDILFEGRNKKYGAYALRREEDKRVRMALIGTASIALVIIAGYILNNQLKAAEKPASLAVIHDLPVMEALPEKTSPPPPPPPSTPAPPPPANSSIRVTVPQIVDDKTEINPDEIPPKMDSVGTKTIGVANTLGDPDGFDNGVPEGMGDKNAIVEAPKSDGHGDGRPFTVVEMMPSFPGGDDALMKYLQKNMRYPRMAAEADIEGRVYVSFIVDWHGNITEVHTVGNHLGGGLEEEAIRVVSAMPQWKPGKQNGQTVSVYFNLPISFHLSHD